MARRVSKNKAQRLRYVAKPRRYYSCPTCGARMRTYKYRGQVMYIQCPRCGEYL